MELNIKDLPRDIKFRFARDFNLPIRIYQEPYFSYLLDLYDIHKNFKIEESLSYLQHDLSLVNSYDEFMEKYHKSKDAILDYLNNHPDLIEFNKRDLTSLLKDDIKPSKNGDIYKLSMCDKEYISIDLNNAYFLSLYNISKEMTYNESKFSDFSKHFTDFKIIQNGKGCRSSLLGRLSQDKICKFSRHIISDIYKYLINELGVNPNKLVKVNIDELIFEADENILSLNLNELDKMIYERFKKENLEYLVSVEKYKLISIENRKLFMKIYDDDYNNFKLKGVSVQLYPQVIKYIYSLQLNDYDFISADKNDNLISVNQIFE